jgi:hypothetical protein
MWEHLVLFGGVELEYPALRKQAAQWAALPLFAESHPA